MPQFLGHTVYQSSTCIMMGWHLRYCRSEQGWMMEEQHKYRENKCKNMRQSWAWL